MSEEEEWEENSSRWEEDQFQHNYYFINKDLFYFFISLYGGGPAIVRIKDFNRHELKNRRSASQTYNASLLKIMEDKSKSKDSTS